MYFSDLSTSDKIVYIKREFQSLIKGIFENPEQLKTLIDEKKISNDQSKVILKLIDGLNTKNCSCCRKMDITKLQVRPIQPELEPLLDIAQSNAKSRTY